MAKKTKKAARLATGHGGRKTVIIPIRASAGLRSALAAYAKKADHGNVTGLVRAALAGYAHELATAVAREEAGAL